MVSKHYLNAIVLLWSRPRPWGLALGPGVMQVGPGSETPSRALHTFPNPYLVFPHGRDRTPVEAQSSTRCSPPLALLGPPNNFHFRSHGNGSTSLRNVACARFPLGCRYCGPRNAWLRKMLETQRLSPSLSKRARSGGNRVPVYLRPAPRT